MQSLKPFAPSPLLLRFLRSRFESRCLCRHWSSRPLRVFSTSKTCRGFSDRRRFRDWFCRLSWKKEEDARHDSSQLPLMPGFLDDSVESSAFNHTRIAGVNEPKLRCTEIDGRGNVTLVDGEFKKSELIAKYGLLPRDLRKIDSSLLPSILVRPSAILINLLHLRVLIKHDRVLIFDVYGSKDSYTQSVFMYDLEGKLRQKDGARQTGGLPYEFRALEAVLISVTSGLEAEFEIVREPVIRVLRALEGDIDREKLRYLLIYSKKLGSFEQKARLVRDAIDDLLEADDDLASMYLTEKAGGKVREEDDHQEVEMLLESYHKICDEIVQESGNLVSNIRNTEEIVKAILDANRNSLMLLDLKFSIGTLGLGGGTLIAGLYGMNLKNFIEESALGFASISAWTFVFSAIICAYGLVKLRKVQRVSMWGEQGEGPEWWAQEKDGKPNQKNKKRIWSDWGSITNNSHDHKGDINNRSLRLDFDAMLPPLLPGETREDRVKRLKEMRKAIIRDRARAAAIARENLPLATNKDRDKRRR